MRNPPSRYNIFGNIDYLKANSEGDHVWIKNLLDNQICVICT